MRENPGRFIVGGYCHMCGFCMGKDHNSSLCSTPVPKHKWEATRANTMGGCKCFSAGMLDGVGS